MNELKAGSIEKMAYFTMLLSITVETWNSLAKFLALHDGVHHFHSATARPKKKRRLLVNDLIMTLVISTRSKRLNIVRKRASVPVNPSHPQSPFIITCMGHPTSWVITDSRR